MKINRSRNRREKIIMKAVMADIKPRFAKLWGQRHWISPRYCGIVSGDGNKIIYLQTGDSRPDYYVLRIDGSMDIEDVDFDLEPIFERIEELFDNVDRYEELFDNVDRYEELFVDDKRMYKEYGETELYPENKTDFPMLSTGNGCWWGLIKKFNF